MTDFVNTFFVVLTLMVRYTLSNCPLSHMPPSKRGVRIDLLNPLLQERASIGRKVQSNSVRLSQSMNRKLIRG